ncbi:hypothetical protein [Cobetia sp. L2A1]|uniref:hypothetical protein n=1 Tax=Cobetia sp. L2A1 TaxID=2686360 RepID=UPI00131CAF14|nr:hypothetical protein [Cobetia sp. L2A1]
MQIVEIYTETRFNPERSILKERLGEDYVVQTCAADAPNFCFEVSQGRNFILGFEVAGARSAEFLSIITEDYVYQHPGILPEVLSEYLKSRARHPLRRQRKTSLTASAC